MQTESPTIQKTRKWSSKARTDRNKRRLKGYIAKKSTPSTSTPTTTENGEPAQEKCLENDPDVKLTNNTKEIGENTAIHTEEMISQEEPLITVLNDDRTLSCKPHEDTACTTGAEGQLSASYAGMEKTERTTRYRLGNINFDLHKRPFYSRLKRKTVLSLFIQINCTPIN